MGLSSSTSKTTPIYDKQVTGAADTLSSVYNAQAPKISAMADQITGMVPSLMDRFSKGTPELNAAGSYITSMLSGNPQSNPMLDQMIALTGDNTAARLKAQMGTRGITGGTAYESILAKALADNELSARYGDYNNQQQLRAQAASMAPGVSSAQSGLLDPVFRAASASTLPFEAASQYSNGIGGLLGQYTKTKQSQPLGGMILGGLASGIGSALSGKFF